MQQVIEMRISHQSHGAFQAVEAAIASQWTYSGVLVYLTSAFRGGFHVKRSALTRPDGAAFIVTALLPDQSRDAGTKYRAVTLPTDSTPPLSRTNNLNP